MNFDLHRVVRIVGGCIVTLLIALAGTPAVALIEPSVSVDGGSEEDDSETSVDIPDPALREAVEDALGKNPHDPITRGEMATLRELSQRGVRQLAGIEYAVNLHWLRLQYGDIANLSPLAALTSLTSLGLHGNEISDVSPLAALTSLTSLDLSNNEILDLSPLAALTSLTFLELYDNGISDVAPLAEFTSLERLDLDNNSIADISPLAGMTSLTSLWLSANEISDVSPLAGMTSLTTLYLGGNEVVELAPLARLTSLTSLGLSDNGISDVSPLSGMTSLTNLELFDNGEISDVSPLAGMTSLTSLGLSANEISDVSPLAGMTSLTTLYLGGNEVVDLAPLEGLTSLEILWLFRNEISDVSPLAGMTSLTSLWLSANEISDVSPLAGMTSLTTLYLGGNEVVELAPLARLTSLTSLGLSDNGISDVSPLSGMTSLTNLELFDNEISDVSPLAGMTSLTFLYLGGNEVVDLAPLEGLTSLEILWLSRNEISDLSPLAGMTSLTTLYLSGNEIVELGPLSGLNSVSRLDLGGNMISDLSSLSGMTSIKELDLMSNGRLEDIAPLVANRGLGNGDFVDLRVNFLSETSRETHIPNLLERGVEVSFDDIVDLSEMPDAGLRGASEWALSKFGKGALADLPRLDAANRGIENLTGLEGATGLRDLFLDGNKVKDISPLAGLRLRTLMLAHNMVGDLAPLADMDSLDVLALDGNALCELPPLPSSLSRLYLSDNCLSDIGPLADLWLRELDVSGNSITSLEPLLGTHLRYLQVDDNPITDISPLNFASLRELHMRNNAVRDISPLLDGEELLMVDVQRNPLADGALGVLETLRQRRVTVLAGEAVPYFPAAGDVRQGFVRVVNRSDEAGHVFIEAVDDAGVRVGPVRMEVGARRAVHFNSGDLERGNAGKGLSGGIGAPTAGDWRLSVISALDVEVLSYIRTEDGFVTAMHDVAADAIAPFFNPGSNDRQRSILRVVNTEAEPAKWTTGGYDDHGQWHPMAGSLLVRPQRALTLTARALEDDHGLGDGHGKWRLRTRGFPWYAMSLLESPTGHLTNLSTAPDNAVELADGRTLHRLPLFPAAGGSRQGFVRVINHSYSSGEVVIEAVDDAGTRSAPGRLTMRPRRAAHFNSMDLETGNADKGLDGGVGVGQGDWRLEVTSELDLMVLSYARTEDGFLTSLHDLAPVAADGGHRVVFFNPGSNSRQVSKLRLINDGERAARVSITGIDDRGSASGAVSLGVPGGSALTFTAAELESGDGDRLAGGLGDGEGKWRLRVRSDEPIAVMSLLETPTGHLTNVSTGTAD